MTLVDEVGAETPAPAPRRPVVRPFDFRRPNKLNRDHVRTIQIIHETFARQFTTVLSSSLRAVSNVMVESIEQLTYDEYVRATPNPTVLTIVSIHPLPGVAILQMPINVALTAVDLMLGGHGKGNDGSRPLTDIELSLFRTLIERALAELAYASESVVDFEPVIVQFESNPQFAQVAAPSDMIVVITYDLRIDSSHGRATLCFPYASLAPVLDAFTGNVIVAERDPVLLARAADAVRERVTDAPVDVSVQFRPITLTSGEILDLEIGDVVPLGQHVESTVNVVVGGSTTFVGRLARRGKRLACQIVAPADKKDAP